MQLRHRLFAEIRFLSQLPFLIQQTLIKAKLAVRLAIFSRPKRQLVFDSLADQNIPVKIA